MQLALSAEQLGKAQEELDELYSRNVELEADVAQLVRKLVEVDERNTAAACLLYTSPSPRD